MLRNTSYSLLLLLFCVTNTVAQNANPAFDSNNDGIINAVDLFLFLQDWHKPTDSTDPPLEYGNLQGQTFIGSGNDLLQNGTVILRQNGKDQYSAEISFGNYSIPQIVTGTYIIRIVHPSYFYYDTVTIKIEDNSHDLHVAPIDIQQQIYAEISKGQFGYAEVLIQRALQDKPDDPILRLYNSVIRILNLFEQPEGQLASVMKSMLLKISFFGSPTFDIPEEWPETSASFEEISAALIGQLILAIDASLQDLTYAKDHQDLQFSATGFERWISPDVELDYSDLLFYEAFLYFIKMETHFLYGYKMPVNVKSIDSMADGFIELLDQNPQLLQSGDNYLEPMNSAKEALRMALQIFETAVDATQQEVDAQSNDFIVYSDTNATKTKSRLAQFRLSLDQAITYPTQSINSSFPEEMLIHLGALFTKPITRGEIPEFRGLYPILESIPDPTFNGLFPGMTHDSISYWLPATYPLNQQIALPEDFFTKSYLSDTDIFFEFEGFLYAVLHSFNSGYTLYKLSQDFQEILNARALSLPSFQSLSLRDIQFNGEHLICLYIDSNTRNPQSIILYDFETNQTVETLELFDDPMINDKPAYSVIADNDTFWLITRNSTYDPITWIFNEDISFIHINQEGTILETTKYQRNDFNLNHVLLYKNEFWMFDFWAEKAFIYNPSTQDIRRVYQMDPYGGYAFLYEGKMAIYHLPYYDYSQWETEFYPANVNILKLNF